MCIPFQGVERERVCVRKRDFFDEKFSPCCGVRVAIICNLLVFIQQINFQS